MKIYNSLSNKKETFETINENKVLMYVCGITPYDTTHLGHAFVYTFFDIFRRYLEFEQFNVVYTQNVTDVDDDILKKAKQEKENWKKLGDLYTKRFLKDIDNLNILKPTNFVKASNYIPTVIKFGKALQNSGFAYENGGNLYFNIKKFENYGKLSKFSERKMLTLLKERGGNPDDPHKLNPLDFILWQKSNEGEPFWESPWGYGRPGWHIECSAMINDTLGNQIDIHGGGKDLIYPHHESEIAQSESLTTKEPLAKYWMHVGTVYYKNKKMSKSLGNLVLVSDLLQSYLPNTIRWMVLSHHYRDDWEFTKKEIDEAEKNFRQFEKILKIKTSDSIDEKIIHEFENIIEDDFNLPALLPFLEKLSKNGDYGSKPTIPSIKKILTILGFR